TEKYPTKSAVELISEKCGVKPENLYLVLTTTRSIAGSTQVSGRIVETGLYRLDFLGFDPKLVVSGVGYAPIMPVHPDEGVTLGREEDALIYGGSTSFIVEYEDDQALKDLIAKAPATTSSFYGKPSYQVLKSVEFDWSKLDPAFFAPGMLRVENLKTGVVHQAGKINVGVLKESLGMA
ncbi:MAG TPA: methenyltetrahydromethanopterin cyclohydrolase, partial [Candidatus Bathyarchaeota archaeon]|nr:methenyltetrahydromethanopterin cyclohydrolase [Candidatus Bathyarchaeota archaeon]